MVIQTAPGKFFGKLNWRIEEPDGEFFTRDALQEFVQDPKNPAHLINDNNEYLHYKDDWYIVDYAADDNKEGVPPFAFVYYRGENDAWVGYGGVVVYTRDSKLPESLLPRLREAAKKVNFDFDKDFTITDNSCKALEKGEEVILREKFAGKMAIQTEQQLQQQAVLARSAAVNTLKSEEKVVENALKTIEEKAVVFEKELVKDVITVEKEIVKDVVGLEKVSIVCSSTPVYANKWTIFLINTFTCRRLSKILRRSKMRLSKKSRNFLVDNSTSYFSESNLLGILSFDRFNL